MKEIELTQGKVALVDDEDYEWLNQWKWYAHKDCNTFYAIRNTRIGQIRSKLIMHRIILPTDMDIDHIDGNGLNNQRSNLRPVTMRQNLQNKHIAKTSKYPGVSRHSPNNDWWRAQICIKGHQTYLGIYGTEMGAYNAYLTALDAINEDIIRGI